MNFQSFDPEDVTLEMQLEYIERLPVIESQSLQRFKNIANPSYSLTKMKYKFLKKDYFLRGLEWINSVCHRIDAWIQKKRS